MPLTFLSQNNQNRTAEVNASYTQPITPDLAYTTIYYRNQNDPVWASLRVLVTEVPLGGAVSKDLFVTIPVENNVIEAQVSSTDTSGNESERVPTPPRTVNIIRDVIAPPPPADF